MNFLSVSVFETLESFSGWVSVGIVAAVILGAAFLFFFNKKALKESLPLAATILFFYAIGMAIVVIAFEIFKYGDEAYVAANGYDAANVGNLFIPLIMGLGVLLFTVIALTVARKKKPELLKRTRIFGGAFSVLAIAASVMLFVL